MTDDILGRQYATLARSSRYAGLVSALGLLLLLGSIAYSYVQLGNVTKQVDAKRADLTRLEKELQIVEAELSKKQEALKKITPAALAGLGNKNPNAPVDPSVVSEAVDAKRAAESLADPAHRPRRSMITLQYYEKKLDDEVNMRVVLAALTDAGFTLQHKPPQIADTPTNSIFYGPDVQVTDIKLVALTLMAAGIKIRTIEPLLPHVSRPRLIQIGANRATRNDPPLTAKQVIDAVSFQ